MAAGRGNRMMPLTQTIPKPLAPYLDSTLIAEGIKQIRPFIPNIHITVGYKGNIVAKYVIDQGVRSVLNTSGKDNAWWVYNTLLKHLNEPVLVLTCDNVIRLEFEKLVEEYFRMKQPACMIVPVEPITNLEGDYLFTTGNVVDKIDRHQVSDIYCSGIQIINPYQINKKTKAVENFYDLWSQLIKVEGVLVSSVYPSSWYSVDTIEHLREVQERYGDKRE